MSEHVNERVPTGVHGEGPERGGERIPKASVTWSAQSPTRDRSLPKLKSRTRNATNTATQAPQFVLHNHWKSEI